MNHHPPFEFVPTDYGPVVAKFVDGTWAVHRPKGHDPDLRPRLKELTNAEVFASPRGDSRQADCCRAAILLWHGFLDESHTISQAIDTAEGSYWHGIMHRCEKDYANAKYWFRRVGDHPIFARLGSEADRIGKSMSGDEPLPLTNLPVWDPSSFVDWCADVGDLEGEQSRLCKQTATLEWRLLFDYCYRQTVGER